VKNVSDVVSQQPPRTISKTGAQQGGGGVRDQKDFLS
jgi:hypothetical protein